MQFTGEENVLLLTSLGENVSIRRLKEIDRDKSLSKEERDNEIKSLQKKFLISEYFFVYYLFAYKDSAGFITNLPVIIDIGGSKELQSKMQEDLHKLGAETEIMQLKDCDIHKVGAFMERFSRKRDSYADLSLSEQNRFDYKKQELDEIIHRQS